MSITSAMSTGGTTGDSVELGLTEQEDSPEELVRCSSVADCSPNGASVSDHECQNGRCVIGLTDTCEPLSSCLLGEACSSDIECATRRCSPEGVCVKSAVGDKCAKDVDCASNRCSETRCVVGSTAIAPPLHPGGCRSCGVGLPVQGWGVSIVLSILAIFVCSRRRCGNARSQRPRPPEDTMRADTISSTRVRVSGRSMP
jgi:hypothetical protein